MGGGGFRDQRYDSSSVPTHLNQDGTRALRWYYRMERRLGMRCAGGDGRQEMVPTPPRGKEHVAYNIAEWSWLL